MDSVDYNKSGHEQFGGWVSLMEDVPEFDMLLNDKLKVSDCYTLAWMLIIVCHYGGGKFLDAKLETFSCISIAAFSRHGNSSQQWV